MDKDIDVLQQYRNISNKLKKRFLKKPNVTEGSEQFGSLAKILRTQDCPQYAGFCNLAQARCEHTLGNWCAEAQTLTEAANNFLEAERAVISYNCPSFQEHLLAAINCCSHAIRVCLESKQSSLASGISVQLGDVLKNIGQPGEAVQHYQRALELQVQNPLQCLKALENIASVSIMTKDYEGALDTLTVMEELAVKHSMTLPGTGSQAGTYRDILKTCEITSVLLLLLLQPSHQRIKAKYARMLETYSWLAKDEEIMRSYLTEDLFLLLQSLVMACQANDLESAKSLQIELWPQLNTEQNHILHLILQQCMQPSSEPLHNNSRNYQSC